MKLILHAGAGKTGSTSIQSTLEKNDKSLREQGVLYLGLMLENAPVKKYEWQQKSSHVPSFHHKPVNELTKEILDVLQPTLVFAREEGFHTLIWSNESFIDGPQNFVEALNILAREGNEIQIVIYVREYASWMKSAYIQWGLKHKTYDGPLQKFSKWAPSHAPKFFKKIDHLTKRLTSGKVFVRNMNEVGDVVKDFLNFSGIKTEKILFSRDNDSPKGEELLLRALFNSKYDEKVLPARFENIFGRKIPFESTPKEYLEDLLPDEDDVSVALEASKEDLEQLNSLLVQQGQNPLKYSKTQRKEVEIDSEKLLMALADMLMQQSRRIDRLERLLKEINPEESKKN